MKYEFELSNIKGIEDGFLLFDTGGKTERIDIRKSADVWWDIHNKTSVMDVILKRKNKNQYVGDKCFNLSQPYFRLYHGEDEFIFKKEMPDEYESSDVCELRRFWDEINCELNKLGYWLFDEG